MHSLKQNMFSVGPVGQDLDIFPTWKELVQLIWVKLCSVAQVLGCLRLLGADVGDVIVIVSS